MVNKETNSIDDEYLEVFTLPHLFRPDSTGHLCHQNPKFSGEIEGFCPVIVRSQFQSFSGRNICPPDFLAGQSMDSPPDFLAGQSMNSAPEMTRNDPGIVTLIIHCY